MSETAQRALTPDERLILSKLLSISAPGIEVLRQQMADARAVVSDEYGSISLDVHKAQPGNFSDGPLITATQFDTDTVENYGPKINVILFVKNGFINELQIYKDDGKPIKSRLNPDLFDLFLDRRMVKREQ
jgi:hypothetical protein